MGQILKTAVGPALPRFFKEASDVIFALPGYGPPMGKRGVAVTLFKPAKSPAQMVKPLREKPGTARLAGILK